MSITRNITAAYNATDSPVVFHNLHNGDRFTVQPGAMVLPRGWTIPNNSNPAKYWVENYRYDVSKDGVTLYTFWSDDSNRGVINYVDGGNAAGKPPPPDLTPKQMPGEQNLGRDEVGFVVSKEGIFVSQTTQP